jgi:hypothetical protein
VSIPSLIQGRASTVHNNIAALSDKTFVGNIKPTLKLTEYRKALVLNQFRKYAEQIGITERDIPSIVFTRKEVLEMPKELTAGRRTVTHKCLGICFRRARTILIHVKKHRSLQELRHTIVHELVHYRFSYLKHGKKFEHRIDHILRGKRYPVKDLNCMPTVQRQLSCYNNNKTSHQHHTDLTANNWADFWRYTIGVNVIPADTRNKVTYVKWSTWQDKPVPVERHDQWKSQNDFSNGMAIIPGRGWHNEDKKELYFTFIDADKAEAITEVCNLNGKIISLQEMSQKFLVEQHKDCPEKAHIYFYSPIPFVKKSADTVIGLEVKGLGEHLTYVLLTNYVSFHSREFPFPIYLTEPYNHLEGFP